MAREHVPVWRHTLWVAGADAALRRKYVGGTEAKSWIPGSADNGTILYQRVPVKGEEHER